MSKRFLISEDEKSTILNLYNSKGIVLTEQSSVSIAGTTSPQPINRADIMVELGLKSANNTNFRGMWSLGDMKDPNASKAKIKQSILTKKNLSDFVNTSPTVDKNKQNYFEAIYGQFNTKDNKSTGKTSSLNVNGIGIKDFPTKYKDKENPNDFYWSIIQINAAGNGLLAFSRALTKVSGTYPYQIQIGLSQTTGGEEGRSASAMKYDAATISNLQPTFSTGSAMIANVLFNKVASQYRDMPNRSELVQKFNLSRYQTPDELVDGIIATLMYKDKTFVPQEELAEFQKNEVYDKSKILPLYTSIVSTPVNNYPVRKAYESNQPLSDFNKNFGKQANLYNQIIQNLFEQYKNRVKKYLSQKQPEVFGQINFVQPYNTIETYLNGMIVGQKTKQGTPEKGATQTKSDAGFKLGSATQNK